MYFMLIGDTTAESNLRNGDYWDITETLVWEITELQYCHSCLSEQKYLLDHK